MTDTKTWPARSKVGHCAHELSILLGQTIVLRHETRNSHTISTVHQIKGCGRGRGIPQHENEQPTYPHCGSAKKQSLRCSVVFIALGR